MIKKSFSITTVLIITILAFVAGAFANKIISPAALSVPFLGSAVQPAKTCIDQKCVAVTSQCSTDSSCATHMQCNSSSQCISVSGPGTNKCSANLDCAPTKDPQKWCEANNHGVGLIVTAQVYPNGKFSCNCGYDVGGTQSEVPCANAHLNE